MPYKNLYWFLVPKSDCAYAQIYTTLTQFSTKHLMMCKVYTGVGGIK